LKCPYCGGTCYAEFVDVGVGVPMQVTPYDCEECWAQQLGSNTHDSATEEEKNIGWFKGLDQNELAEKV
jgi:hypothetical protein